VLICFAMAHAVVAGLAVWRHGFVVAGGGGEFCGVQSGRGTLFLLTNVLLSLCFH
jgi:hypothetical protein